MQQLVVGAGDIPWLEPEDGQLLDLAPLRYTALCAALSPLSWQVRLASLGELLREVARDEPRTRAACVRVVSRLEIEEVGPAVPALLARVDRARAQLERRAARRLGRAAGLPLEVLLEELEQAAMAAAPAPLDELEAWRLARRLLPRSLPLLEVASSASARLAAFAARGPLTPALAFLPPPAELPGVLDAHQLASESLEALRARLLRLDLSGRVESLLWSTGRTPPRGAPRNGAEQLCAAIFWSGLCGSRLADLGASLVAPVHLRPEELRPVLEAWIAARGSRLPEPVAGAITPERGALLRLAMWLHAPPDAFHPAPSGDALRALAETAALSGEADPDVHLLSCSVRAALMKTGWSPRPDASLAQLVQSLGRVQPPQRVHPD